MSSHFGGLLRACRHVAGKTQRELAEVLGCSVPYLSDVERGRRAPLPADQICQAVAFLQDPKTPIEDDVQGLMIAAARDRGYVKVRIRSFDEAARVVTLALHLEGTREGGE